MDDKSERPKHGGKPEATKSAIGQESPRQALREEANSPEERRELARKFYKENKFEQGDVAAIEKHLEAIDINKDVAIRKYPPGTIFAQAQSPSKQKGEHPSGHYFMKPGGDATRLGVSGESKESTGRKVDYFITTRETQVLCSTAKDAHSWYRNGRSGELLYGGEQQCCAPDLTAFRRIVDADRLRNKNQA